MDRCVAGEKKSASTMICCCYSISYNAWMRMERESLIIERPLPPVSSASGAIIVTPMSPIFLEHRVNSRVVAILGMIIDVLPTIIDR